MMHFMSLNGISTRIPLVHETLVGFNNVRIQDAAIFFISRLPHFHRDPFDRLPIAHSITGHYHLATVDQQILQYPVLTIA